MLDVYTRPYDAKRPVICMDESPKQLIGEVREPIPMQPGKVRKIDDEYMRFGTAEIFGAIEPLKGKQFYEVQPTRTKADWARFIKRLVDEEYADAEKIVLVMDNLNTHTVDRCTKLSLQRRHIASVRNLRSTIRRSMAHG